MLRSGALLLLLALGGVWAQDKPGLLELNAETFAATFKALPEDRWVLIEFFAHW
jgi:hypothetical protein